MTRHIVLKVYMSDVFKWLVQPNRTILKWLTLKLNDVNKALTSEDDREEELRLMDSAGSANNGKASLASGSAEQTRDVASCVI